jgi:TAT-translocated FGD2 family F420-dependent dehydrogenase
MNSDEPTPARARTETRMLDRRTLLTSGAAIAGAGVANRALGIAGDADQAETEDSSVLEKPASLQSRLVGFMLAHEQFASPELVRLGAHAERAGFDLLATSDHFQPWQANQGHAGEAWVTLGALTRKTHRTWMGPTVTCPILRYRPAVVAETFASLSLARPGRVFLGIGSGEALNEEASTGQWPAWKERWDRLIEAATIIRALWTGKPVHHHGTFYKVDGLLYDPPPQPIPLLMAANGPKAMRLAGEHGDGLVTDPKTWKQFRSEWEGGVTASGRNPGDLPVLVEQYVVVGNQNDAAQAAELWRFTPKAFKGYQNIPDPAQIQRRAEAEIPIKQVIEGWAIGIDPAVHIQTIEALFASGVTIVNIHSGQPEQRRVIDFYGEHVLPHVSSAAAR